MLLAPLAYEIGLATLPEGGYRSGEGLVLNN